MSCSVVFVSKSMQSSVHDILNIIGQSACLSIGETPHFCEQGGMIGLKIVSNKIRFDINRNEAKRADITISSQVLKLANIVKTNADRRNSPE